MTKIVPTITAGNAHIYRSEMERVADFATRLHIDFSDGEFAPTKLIKLEQAWWPNGKQIDFHIMYKRPAELVESLIALKPDLVVLHAESEGDLSGLLAELKSFNIATGVALLADSLPEDYEELIKSADHVLLFGGKLGYHGGEAALSLLSKVPKIKELNPAAELAWDGGITADNARPLADAGIDVLNVGGFIQQAKRPQEAYDIIDKTTNA